MFEQHGTRNVKRRVVKSEGVSAFGFGNLVEARGGRDFPDVDDVISPARNDLPVVHGERSNRFCVSGECECFVGLASILRRGKWRCKETRQAGARAVGSGPKTMKGSKGEKKKERPEGGRRQIVFCGIWEKARVLSAVLGC